MGHGVQLRTFLMKSRTDHFLQTSRGISRGIWPRPCKISNKNSRVKRGKVV